MAYAVSSGPLAGKTVISYRGTDSLNPFATGNDISNGWFAGQGEQTSQLELALDFYQAVRNSGVPASEIVLTGHSLGGGLAGFVAMLHQHSGVQGYGFDHMPLARHPFIPHSLPGPATPPSP